MTGRLSHRLPIALFPIALIAVSLRMAIAFGDDNASDAPRGLSIVGCMTTACHGSNIADSPISQRAGRIWFDQDPHAQAYTNLLTNESAKIVSRLVNQDLTPTSPAYRKILEAKCVSCHASEHAPESQRVLGADCQVCHGQADAWGSAHYAKEWQALGKNRFDDSRMLNVESLASRAQVCASCHIGERNRTGLDREVDHRLMAAGHPSMHFDYESYLRRYPVHWDTKNEPIGSGSSIGFERWRIGKIASAIVRLKLLADRAEGAMNQSIKTSDWPELTEYSCTSCHHALVQPSWRQSKEANAIAVWDNWCLSQLETAIRDQSIGELKNQILGLKSRIEQVSPDPGQVAISAESLRRWLKNELEYASTPNEHLDNLMLQKLRTQVETVPNFQKFQDWESSAQWYIATRVLTEGLGMKSSLAPIPLLYEDPFTGDPKTWKPGVNKEFNGSSLFEPDMLGNYQLELIKQLRTRP